MKQSICRNATLCVFGVSEHLETPSLLYYCFALFSQKWTAQLDKYLKEGVRRHGHGKWARILLDYDFEGRTGTMLKDRWRILIKDH